ncbi:MAG TPA: hypothetical protein H9814_00965 [Candidatus Bacteroides merdigallinarum]|uniref:Ferrichrome ABC transporter substrate-binding protein n=1 Tax=Candidatus Bacteroides merdigallinarum TaxID=2838473 RepID=A0A9D2J0J0_9BACE|nr:hypothetical protein [Candidatus Bacteroides merdigallinarum]
MEEFLKFLLVAAVLVVAFIRQTRKEAQKKQAPLPPFMPQTEAPASPLPDEEKDQTYGGYIPEGPAPEPATPSKPERKPHIANASAKERPRQSAPKPTPPPATAPTAEDGTTDYQIHSAEEARRAIIWSEILTRKY